METGRILAVELVHSRNVLFVNSRAEAATLLPRAAARGGADGIISTDPEFIPSVTVADCMPIWLWVKGTRITGVLHSGWRGTGILSTAIDSLGSELGVQPTDICVVLGPAIGSCCYHVDEVRAGEFAENFGDGCVSKKDGRFFLDLRKANEGLAASMGVEWVENIDICTACDDSLGSFRRQGQGEFTRMMALCGYF